MFFGEQQAYGLVELVKKEVGEFSYDQMVAFEFDSQNAVAPISEISKDYLCDDSCLGLPFLQSEEWAPSAGPVQVGDIKRSRLDQEPPNSAFRLLLVRAADFSTRYPLP